MTTVEFAHHLLGYCTFRDVGEAQAADAQELALVMSQAVEEWFALAPAHYKKTLLTQRQEEPETLSVQVVADSVTVVGAPFPTGKRGSTIFLGSDPRPNEVVAPNTLLYPYSGESGTVTGTLYHNCVAFPDFLIERVCTHPVVVTAMGNGYSLTPLAHNARAFSLPITPAEYAAPSESIIWTDKAATPKHYWMEAIGGSHQVDVDGVFQLKMWPLPLTEFVVQFDAEVLPLAYRIDSLLTPSALPIADSVAHRTLIPLARGWLANSPIFDEERHGRKHSSLLDAAESARVAIRQLAATWIASDQRVGTPFGY